MNRHVAIMLMNTTTHFSPDALCFLNDLREHNDRTWFEGQRARFESALLMPFVAFLVDLQPKLERIAPQFVIHARPRGGSIARIHRDMRFAPWSTSPPYKTALSAFFTHRDGRDGARPSLFVVVEPGRTRVGGGFRDGDLDPHARRLLKTCIEQDSGGWQRAKNRAAQKGATRHRYAMAVPIADGVVTTARFLDDVVAACAALVPFVNFVSRGVELPN